MIKNKEPLHKTVHYRKLRTILSNIVKIEKNFINPNMFDDKHIICYRTSGDNLVGNNVKFTNIHKSRCCFVGDNEYEVYEIPYINNNQKTPFSGEFLVLCYNVAFGYWLLLRMTERFIVSNNVLKENIEFYSFGEYEVTNQENLSVKKVLNGNDCDRGNISFYNNDVFDKYRYRYYSYHIDKLGLIKKFDKKVVADNTAVKIYKNKK